MKNYLFIISFSALVCFASNSALLSEKINLNYQDLSASYSNIQMIYDKYAVFKEKIEKNTTQQYNACVEQIKEYKCNNVDQWMSVIAELKLENENSEQIEIPFLKDQKQRKLDEYRETLILFQYYEFSQQQEIKMIQQFQKGIENATEQIKVMYRLPEEPATETEFIQKSVDGAKESIQKAKEEYDIADISIQAQTATNVMSSLSAKIPLFESAYNEQYNIQLKLLTEKKERLKEEILHLRALLQNEQVIQQKNKEKIASLNDRISQCKNRPTNIEKDCGPILVIAEKLFTEINVVNTRTNVLMKELENLLNQNGGANKEEQQKQLEQREKQKEFDSEWNFADQQQKELEQDEQPNLPVEQKPIRQIKDQQKNQKEIEKEPEIQDKEPEIEEQEEPKIEEQEEPKIEEKEPEIEEKKPEIEENQPKIEENQPKIEENQPKIEQEKTASEETQASDAMVFAYKSNPEYQAINQNTKQLNHGSIEDQLNSEDEESLDKLLEKEFADEDNSNGNDEAEESDIQADQFDYNSQ